MIWFLPPPPWRAAAARRIKAKTGTPGHASALSGYAESPKRGLVAFSIFVNNYNCPPDAIRFAIDRIALALAELRTLRFAPRSATNHLWSIAT